MLTLSDYFSSPTTPLSPSPFWFFFIPSYLRQLFFDHSHSELNDSTVLCLSPLQCVHYVHCVDVSLFPLFAFENLSYHKFDICSEDEREKVIERETDKSCHLSL